MEFSDVIQRRYSVRAYKSDPVEEAKLAKVLEAARLAPTAANLQPFRFVVAHVKGREAELRRVYGPGWFVQAPVVICACGIPSQGWVRDADAVNYTPVDVAIAMDHLILAAADQGLGTCWIAAFDVPAARQAFALPPGVEPVALTPLGYPADRPGRKERKPLAELVRYEHW
jgi:nitroreductase